MVIEDLNFRVVNYKLAFKAIGRSLSDRVPRRPGEVMDAYESPASH